MLAMLAPDWYELEFQLDKNNTLNQINVLYVTFETGLLAPLLNSQILSYAKSLSKDGIRFHILSFESKEDLKLKAYELQNIIESLQKYNIKVWIVKRSTLVSPLPSIVAIIQGVLFGLWICFRHKIRIIHARSLIPAISAVVISLISRIPWVFDPRILHAEAGALAGFYTWGGNKYKTIKFLEITLASLADAVRVESIQHREEYLKLVSNADTQMKKYSIITNAVDLNKFSRNLVKRKEVRDKLGIGVEPVLVYSGILSHGRPNLEMFLFARYLSERCGDMHLLILSYTKKEDIVALISKAGYEKKYTILSVTNQEIPAYLSASDISVFFLDKLAHKHSIPMKLGEYLACELPVVTNSGFPTIEKILKEYSAGIVLDNYDKETLICGAELAFCLLDKTCNVNLNCRQAAKKEFNFIDTNNIFKSMYKNVLS